VWPSPDGEGYCCAPGEPNCECMPLGAFVTDPSECDLVGCAGAHPMDWHLTWDAHGCPIYTLTSEHCCRCADAGQDGGDDAAVAGAGG